MRSIFAKGTQWFTHESLNDAPSEIHSRSIVEYRTRVKLSSRFHSSNLHCTGHLHTSWIIILSDISERQSHVTWHMTSAIRLFHFFTSVYNECLGFPPSRALSISYIRSALLSSIIFYLLLLLNALSNSLVSKGYPWRELHARQAVLNGKRNACAPLHSEERIDTSSMYRCWDFIKFALQDLCTEHVKCNKAPSWPYATLMNRTMLLP